MSHRLALLGLLLGATSPRVDAATSAKPNIVYILADDLGYGDVQALNPTRGKIKTPHLDRLAAQGMTFTDAHSGSSVCTPTRYGQSYRLVSWGQGVPRSGGESVGACLLHVTGRHRACWPHG